MKSAKRAKTYSAGQRRRRTPSKAAKNVLHIADYEVAIDELSTELRANFGISKAYLSAKQWQEISYLSGLPKSAGFDVNTALRTFWNSRLGMTNLKGTIDDIKRAQRLLQKTIPVLLELSDNHNIIRRQILHALPVKVDHLAVMRSVALRMHDVDSFLESVREGLSYRSGHPSLGPIYDLIQDLDRLVQRRLGLKLHRSNKIMKAANAHGSPSEFVHAIVKIASPKAADSTIDTVFADYISNRRKVERRSR